MPRHEKNDIEDQQRIAEVLRLEGLKHILTDPNGRKYLWDQLEAGYIFDTTMTGNSQTFSREGRRQAALGLFLDILDVDPSAFTEMYKKFRGNHV